MFNNDLFLEAKNYYEKALSFFPERRQILYNLSLTYFYLGDFLNASLHIKKLIEIGYKDQEIINLFVEIYLKKQELNSALDYLTKINDQDPLIEILYGVASIHFYKKEDDKCLEILDNILEKNDKFYLAYALIGLIYADKDILESLNYLIKSVELNKNYSQGFYLIASTYKELGEPELAEEYYKKCYNLDTKNNNCIIEENLILPVICSDNSQLEKYRERYDNNLTQIYNDTNLSSLNTVDFPENLRFYLSYNNFDNLPIIKKKIKLLGKSLKKLIM